MKHENLNGRVAVVTGGGVALDGKRRGKLRRQEIEIYYSFVGKVELPDT